EISDNPLIACSAEVDSSETPTSTYGMVSGEGSYINNIIKSINYLLSFLYKLLYTVGEQII
ncbi:hypothetical protein P4S83_04445, partial [Aneurinibacillus thermoaerophilus]|nr:hypothetical protein [Aneurinibacillus thermoaerophilus]MED0765137.1 hypothetical protein [Aneurinibacillus thermoaerophilus]